MRSNFPTPIKDSAGFEKATVTDPDISVLDFPTGQANYCEITFMGDPGTYSGLIPMGFYTLCDQNPDVATEIGLPIYNGMNIVLQSIMALRQFKAVAVTTFNMQIQYYNYG